MLRCLQQSWCTHSSELGRLLAGMLRIYQSSNIAHSWQLIHPSLPRHIAYLLNRHVQ